MKPTKLPTLEELRKEFDLLSKEEVRKRNITSESPEFWDELSTDEQIAQLEKEIASEEDINISIPEDMEKIRDEIKPDRLVPKTPLNKASATDLQKDKNNEKTAPQKFMEAIKKLFSPIKKLLSLVKKLFNTEKNPGHNDIQDTIKNARSIRQNARQTILKLRKEQQKWKDNRARRAAAKTKAKKMRIRLNGASSNRSSKRYTTQNRSRSRNGQGFGGRG